MYVNFVLSGPPTFAKVQLKRLKVLHCELVPLNYHLKYEYKIPHRTVIVKHRN